MPRKDFRKDLEQASVPERFPRLSGIGPGCDDGSISFTYTPPFSSQMIDIQATVSDTSEYPRDHVYFVFSTTDNIAESVADTLEHCQSSFHGLTIEDFLTSIRDCIDKGVLGMDPRAADNSNEDGSSPDDEMDWEDEDSYCPLQVTDNPAAIEAMRSDLRVAKAAGYKVGYSGSFSGAVIVTLSCRIGKLGISKDAMQAWDVRPTEFLVLLIRFPQGYTQLDGILNPPPGQPTLVQMRVGLCDSYKPSLASALHGFIHTATEGTSGPDKSHEPSLRPIFTGKSIEELLNDRLVGLVKHRLQHGLSWTGAEQFFNDNQGRVVDADEAHKPVYHVSEVWDSSAPRFLVSDHLSDSKNTLELSFPLIAMQFSLRRFVKCSEFCLNCYCRIDSGFEAIKPYVCSKGLCLYQYMQLGMGPSIEWEIRSQPHVVDMLISFAYSRAHSDRLTDFPSGLGLKVPGIFGDLDVASHAGTFDASDMTIQVADTLDINVGDWIVIGEEGTPIKSREHTRLHCRVQDATYKPRIQLSEPIHQDGSPQLKPAEIRRPVQFVVYDTNFDDLNIHAKREAIVMLLDTLPSIDAMTLFMDSGLDRSNMRRLDSWRARISPSALYVLRWIVASNRSCIMYDDNPENQVSGMKDYLQFRLAQGAPDKEQRFVHSVHATTARLGLEHPTLFAWHGTALHNWHSILREGLHFKTVVHGRAFGNGVYMANQFGTSLGYTGNYPHITGSVTHGHWPNSKLQIQMAISLNEVVNAPREFVHSSSCYVVSNLDWIQPRYLFIKCGNESLKADQSEKPPSAICVQDPHHLAYGPNGQAVVIPISALSSRRGQHPLTANDVEQSHTAHKRSGRPSKKLKTTEVLVIPDDDDAGSVTTLAEDREFLQSDTDAENPKGWEDSYSQTDFRPGSLQESSLKLLGPPTYATPSATRTLQQRLQETLKVQAREPLHELGWYIDKDLINNVYQWIAELHSFDPALALAKDLKAAGLTSIVLELRFPPEFPYSPPFVRVIRPRFLPFSLGGGGHVTAGGAMCMELLTSSGWSSASSIESVLLQVRMAITNTEPRPARLESRARQQEYSVGEAIEAYKRVCQIHGWQIPNDLYRISW